MFTPPVDGQETDEDSDYSDDEHDGNINHLGPAMLKAEGEVVLHHNVQPEPLDSSDEDELNPSLVQSFQAISGMEPENSHDSSDDDLPLSSFIKSNQTLQDTPPKKCKPNPPTEKNKKAVAKKRKAAVTKKRRTAEMKDKIKWDEVEPVFVLNTQCNVKTPPADLQNKTTSVDFFSLFFDENVMQHIIQQSNAYALEKNANMPLNVTKEELHVFFGGLLLSGYGKYTNKRMYWAREDDVPKILSDSMRLNRFESILRNLHLNDNTQTDKEDKLYKLRPLISILNKNFNIFGGLEENLSIDESMIPYYGKHYAKHYIKGKPIRFGFKNWALCTDNGYMLAFDIYTGKSAQTEKRDFGLGGQVVLSLIDLTGIPSIEGYKLFFDNYFTSVALLSHLSDQGYCASGTIREPVRYDERNHIVDYCPTDRRCATCGKKANFICMKCNVGLHPKNCFLDYHKR